MAARPMLVIADTTITYDGVPQRIIRGTVIDVPASSALNTALGANIAALTSQQVTQGGSDSLGPSAYATGQLTYTGIVGGIGDEHQIPGNN